jgi:putative membrane protein
VRILPDCTAWRGAPHIAGLPARAGCLWNRAAHPDTVRLVGLPSPTSLEWSPLLLAGLAGTGAVMARLRPGWAEAGAAQRRWRGASVGGGLLLLAIAFVSPVATLGGHYLLTFHLVQVTLVMGFAPPLLLLGVPRGARLRPRRLRFAARAVVHPAVAIVLVNAVFFGVHAPVLYDAALTHPPLYAVQMLLLFAVSLAFWWAIVEPTGQGPWTMNGLFKLGYILLATIPQTFAGLLFALAHRTFYAPYAAAPRVVALDALGDQQVAGALMAVISKLALFGAFSVILWRVLDGHGQEDEYGDDGGHGGGGDRPQPAPPGMPAWLDMLRRGRTVPEPSPRRAASPEPREPAPSRR